MATRLVEISDLPSRFGELLAAAAAGTEVILTEGNVPRAKLLALPAGGQHRVPGLHPGAIVTPEDFDAPLPDDFWLGAS
jgi:antitoxin (DNA-binding transcriptional repressor) of toxin-antitoxin stability system